MTRLQIEHQKMNTFLKLIIFGLFFTCAVEASPTRTKSVIQATFALPQDTTRLSRWKYLAEQAADTPDQLLYLDALLHDARLQHDLAAQAYAHRAHVWYYFNRSDMDSTLLVGQPALEFYQKNGLSDLYFEIKSFIITLHTDRGEYEFALAKGEEMYQEAASLSSDKGKISACYVLAFANTFSSKFHDAIFWSREGLRLIGDRPDFFSQKMEFNFTLADCYRENQPDSMKLYVDLVKGLVDELEKTDSAQAASSTAYYRCWINCRYADYALQHNQPEQARRFLEQATSYKEKSLHTPSLYFYYTSYSDYYLATGQYEKALHSLETEVKQWEKNKGEIAPAFLERRALIHFRMGNDTLALDEIRQSIHLSDSVNRQRFADQSDQLRSLYEIKRLEDEGKKRTGIIRVQLLALTCLGALLLLLAFYFCRFYRIRKQVAIAAREADEANRTTSGFLSNMQQGIQAFLHDITRTSDRLIREPDPGKRSEYAGRLRTQNELAQHVIFNILDVSKIESGRMKFNYDEINLEGLVLEARSALQNNPFRHVEIHISATGDLLITTDALRLHQLLTNLLRYAVLHTNGKEIRLTYHPEGNSVRFTISGENWVISEEEKQRMFDRLAQTSGTLQEMELEMIISRGLILKLGGSIQVYTGASSRFEFLLPQSPTPENDPL